MPTSRVSHNELRMTIELDSLNFRDTSELLESDLLWIGQDRAQAAAYFGLKTHQPAYNLFVLGEVGSGRSSLLLQAMHQVASGRQIPPDLCFIHNFEKPELPLVLRLPKGQGERLQQYMASMIKRLQSAIPSQLDAQSLALVVKNELRAIQSSFITSGACDFKISRYFDQVAAHILENLEMFQVTDDDEEARLEALGQLISRLQINLAVDNSQLSGAPVIVENNPVCRSLFGGIEYQTEHDVLVTDHLRIRAGSLLKAHGGFIMLHLRDLLADDWALEKLRRFLRSGKIQIEEPSLSSTPVVAESLIPEPIEVSAKIVLIGSSEQYYEMQDLDPEFARHFRVKVDFVDSFASNIQTRRETSVFIAHTCRRLGLPHFSAGAAARLIEESHRLVDDQARQSAIFGMVEAIVIESATFCSARGVGVVESQDIDAALLARKQRHDYPEQCLQESISDGERLITVEGEKVGQLNGLALVDQGDYRFGIPVRVTAHTFAGDDGLLNIEREVEMSGPIHDKGVLVLHSYLSTLFAHLAPLALSASLSFEQEYGGVEGDSASCAEFYALLSSLSGLPLRQGIAVTGAVNLNGDVLPVGGINEKIEGFFHTCAVAGLNGHQGVLIPHRNRRHLMLTQKVVDAVSKGLFHVYTVEHVSEGLELLTGRPSGLAAKTGRFRQASVLGLAQKTLLAYRRACQMALADFKTPPRRISLKPPPKS